MSTVNKINSKLISQLIKGGNVPPIRGKKDKKEKDYYVDPILREVPESENIIRIESEIGDPKNDSLEKVLKFCKVDKKLWDVRDFNVKELASGKFLWTVHFKKGNKKNVDVESILKEYSKISPEVKLKDYGKSENGLLAEIELADVHLSKLCTLEEVGNTYDLKTAVKIFRDVIDYKVEQLKKYNVERILFPIGNDYLHFDNLNNCTTAGTQQDVSSRYYEMFREGGKLLIESINKLQQIAPVDCLVIHGNHGRLSEFALGEVLSAYFHNNENVSINNNFCSRKYYRFQNNLLLFLHGDGVKLNDIPLIMASENAKEWGATKFHWARVGHYHHQKMILNETSGCVTEIFSSLGPSDKWHYDKGYCNNLRSSVTSLYDRNNGLVTKIYYNL